VSDPAAKQIAVPTADDGRAVAGLDTGAGVRQVRVDPRAHDFDEQTDTLAPQLVAGISPTKITNGEYAPDGRLVAGDVAELVRVVRRTIDAPQGTVTPGELQALESGRPTGVATIRGGALLDTPEGLARLDGFLAAGAPPRSEFDSEGQRGLVPSAGTTDGLFTNVRVAGGNKALSMPVRFDGGGKPGARTVTKSPAEVLGFYATDGGDSDGYFSVRQHTGDTSEETGTSTTREVRRFYLWDYGAGIGAAPRPAAAQARTLADRLNALAQAYNDSLRKLSALAKDAPERAALLATIKSVGQQITAEGGFVPSLSVGEGVEGGFTEEADTDVTAHEIGPDTVEVWGSLDPYDPEERTHLDESWRGKQYPPGLWAPHLLLDLNKLIGKPPPPDPPPQPPPPEPQPPPGGGEEDEEEEEEPETDPQQERIGAAYVTPGSGVGLDDDEDDALEVPSGGAVTTDTIDDGDGIAISPVKDGILVVDGGEEDQIDLGGGPQIDDGDDDDPEDEPVPATHCPIGGKREPVVTVREVVIGGHVFIETRVDGVVVSLVRKEGGILTPTNADANTTPPPPPGGTGEVSSGGKTYTYDGGKLTGVRQDAGGVLTPTGQTPSGPTPPSSGTGTVEYGGKTYTYEGGKVTRVGQNSGGIIGGPAP
jgi:hypothetical protein